MLAPEELRIALAGETERVEWKESAAASDLLHAISALANDLGETGLSGYVVLGVDNRGGAVGEDASDSGLQKIA